MKILYEDNDIVLVIKPPNMPSQPDKNGTLDLFSLLNEKYSKDKNVEIGLVHRLDRPVGGIMIFAKNINSLRKLNIQIKNREINKYYVAKVCGIPQFQSKVQVNYIKKLKTINMAKVYETKMPYCKRAVLEYKVLDIDKKNQNYTYLNIYIHTGRFHQIRAQLSYIGLPIWGDRKYNKAFVKSKGDYNLALWAHTLSFRHPISNKPMSFSALPPCNEPWVYFDSLDKFEYSKEI